MPKDLTKLELDENKGRQRLEKGRKMMNDHQSSYKR